MPVKTKRETRIEQAREAARQAVNNYRSSGPKAFSGDELILRTIMAEVTSRATGASNVAFSAFLIYENAIKEGVVEEK